MMYGAIFPAFAFPEGSTSSYFFKQLAGDSLTGSISFPEGDGNDMYKLNVGLVNEICLTNLIADLIESPSLQSDIKAAAEKAASLINMFGIEGCFNLAVKEVNKDEGSSGIKLGFTSNFTTFDASAVDWSVLFDSIENSAFQNFLLLSGSASKEMADSVFLELLSLMGISEKVEYTFDVGVELNRLFNSFSGSRRASEINTNFVDPNDGSILLGSYAIGFEPITPPSSQPSGIPTRSPVAGPPVYPTSLPSGIPTRSPASSSPTGVPTGLPFKSPLSSSPTGMPTGRPTKSPVPAVPSGMPTGRPSKSPVKVMPSSAPSGQPSSVPTYPLPTSHLFTQQPSSKINANTNSAEDDLSTVGLIGISIAAVVLVVVGVFMAWYCLIFMATEKPKAEPSSEKDDISDDVEMRPSSFVENPAFRKRTPSV